MLWWPCSHNGKVSVGESSVGHDRGRITPRRHCGVFGICSWVPELFIDFPSLLPAPPDPPLNGPLNGRARFLSFTRSPTTSPFRPKPPVEEDRQITPPPPPPRERRRPLP